MKGKCEFEGNVEGLENLFDVITVKDLGEMKGALLWIKETMPWKSRHTLVW